MIYRTAAILAAHGFLALPFGYSNGLNAGDIINVALDRTAEALAALRAHELSGSRIGLYGLSRGAEHALLLASLMARDSIAGLPDAIAVHTPPDVICGAFNSGCGAILVIPDGSPGTLQIGRGRGVDRRTNCSRLRRSKSSVSTVRFF
jgi:hypothetical protein